LVDASFGAGDRRLFRRGNVGSRHSTLLILSLSSVVHKMRNTSFDAFPSATTEPIDTSTVFAFGLADDELELAEVLAAAADVTAAAEAELERGAVDCLAVNCALGALLPATVAR